MKISVNSIPEYNSSFPNVEQNNYYIEAKFTADEEATGVDIVKMLMRAMELEGYDPIVIHDAFIEVANYMIDFYDIRPKSPY